VIAAVLFDLDETLLDRTTSLRAFLADQYERYADCLGSAMLEDWRSHFVALEKRGGVHKSVVYPVLLAEFGANADLAGALLADYQSRCTDFAQPCDGMAAVLGAVRSRGLKVGIVTNGETDFQTRHIRALGLERLVDAIFISEMEGLRKPDAALFLRAAAVLGAKPTQCLFVGDNPVVDVLGAAAAGMKTAWFRRGADWPADGPANPGVSIGHLSELLSLIEA
jgi:putative hydrolase of the HAD superfamily